MLKAATIGAWAKSGYTAKHYVQDGLISMWDGIENAGWGVHDPNATVWHNLIDVNNNITLMNKAHFSANSLITDSDYNMSGQIDTLIPWASIQHAEYQIDVLAAPGTVRDFFCSLSTTWRSPGGYAMAVRCLAWNNNGTYKKGLMVKAYSVRNTGIGNVPSGELSCSIGYGALAPNSVAVESFYLGGNRVATSWIEDGAVIQTGYIGGNGNGIYCEMRSIRYYNRVLTDAEVAANYAIDRARFGLP